MGFTAKKLYILDRVQALTISQSKFLDHDNNIARVPQTTTSLLLVVPTAETKRERGSNWPPKNGMPCHPPNEHPDWKRNVFMAWNNQGQAIGCSSSRSNSSHCQIGSGYCILVWSHHRRQRAQTPRTQTSQKNLEQEKSPFSFCSTKTTINQQHQYDEGYPSKHRHTQRQWDHNWAASNFSDPSARYYGTALSKG
jgi:hypothetical protein